MPRGAAKIDKPKKPKQTKILKQSNEERKVILINGIGTTENPLKKKLWSPAYTMLKKGRIISSWLWNKDFLDQTKKITGQ